MGSIEMTCHGLECSGGCGSSGVSNDDGKDESICFPKATESSCSCQSYSAADSSTQGHDTNSRRVSSVVATDCVVDIENGVDEVRISVGAFERECRICMLSLDNSESGIAIELGCSCKDELGAVHQQCAETWFTSKGNNVCEICNSIAQNVVVPNNIESRRQISQVNTVSANAASVPIFETNSTVSTNAVPAVRVTGVGNSSDIVFVELVSNVNSSSTNAVSVPVSSTSTSQASLRCDWVGGGCQNRAQGEEKL